MLDTANKKLIDSLCNILVSKFPVPQDQVDQITIGLMYKFMSDMDNDSIKLYGGEKSFFIAELEKFSWENVMSLGISGSERAQLYKKGIESFEYAKNLPKLFRDIFKDAPSPMTDEEKLNKFLKKINEFSYENSETLGHAYEYLLSKTGAQGKLGQFRTPRHIIDFLVSIINPTKDEKILDPACGTAGFLISAYKHILETNPGDNQSNSLSAEDLNKITKNIVGYDIEPKMVRTSLVNLHLHDFSNPNISEYDLLSDDSKWNDYFDVILANPPFFSPEEGINPHNRFTIQSGRAELLFLSYIIEHLLPNGRAGIIVPEGIHFNGNSQFTKVRNALINKGLVIDISLPHGVFKPYASVKTHILIVDQKLASKCDDILFIELTNDGFSQTDTRKPVEGEQLSKSLEIIDEFKNKGKLSKRFEDPLGYCVPRDEILNHENFNLIGRWYDLPNRQKKTSDFPLISLDSSVIKILKGETPTKKTPSGDYRFIVSKKEFRTANKFDYECNAVCIPKVSSSGHGKADIKTLQKASGKFALASTMIAIAPIDSDSLSHEYLYEILNHKKDLLLLPMMKGATNVTLDESLISEINIPNPDINFQNEFVSKVKTLKKGIKALDEIVSNYKIEFKASKEYKEFSFKDLLNKKIISLRNGSAQKNLIKDGIIPYIKISDMNIDKNLFRIKTSSGFKDDVKDESKIVKKHSIIFPKVGQSINTNKKRLVSIDCLVDGNTAIVEILDKSFLDPRFFFYAFSTLNLSDLCNVQDGYTSINQASFGFGKIRIPDIKTQNKIADELDQQIKTIEGNIELKKEYINRLNNLLDSIF